MLAAVYRDKNEIEIKEIDKPVLKENGAIIKVHGCGLCGSDIVKSRENLAKSGTVLGHEVVGEIVEIKSNDKTFKVGDKVSVGHHVPCFECTYCKNENYSMCRDFKESNIIPGGFAEYIYVSEGHLQNTVNKIEDKITEIEASFTEPTACCLRAVKRANVEIGDNVFIIGLGSIGLIMGQLAKHYGAAVHGCDLLDERINLAKELGFDGAYKFTTLEETVIKYKEETNNIGADKVFLTSGSAATLPLALAGIRDGGKIIVFASIPSDETGFANNDIYYRELTVMGSYSPAPADLCKSLELIKDGKIKVDKFAKVYRLESINEAIADTVSNKIIKAYIKL
jgi:L-iditol 2-dehydrogenase